MALSATDVHAEERDRHVVGQPIRVLDPGLEEVDRRLGLRVGIVWEHDLAEDRVPGFAVGQGGLQVVANTPAATIVAGHGAVEHHIQLIGLEPGEAGRGDQSVDEVGPLARVGPSDVLVDFTKSGDATDQVQRQPPDERGVVGLRGRRDAAGFNPSVDVMVDSCFDRSVRG